LPGREVALNVYMSHRDLA